MVSASLVLAVMMTTSSGAKGDVTLDKVILSSEDLVPVPASLDNRPDGALFGRFTVNAAGNQIYFSKGNLWDSGDGELSFESRQYDSCDSYMVDHISYFHQTSRMNNDLGGFYCSSNNVPDGTWRTLSRIEWNFIFKIRNVSNVVNGVVSAKYMKCSVEGKNGVLIFPDVFSWPETNAAPAESTATTVNGARDSFSVEYTALQFRELELCGCVFLPVTGYCMDDSSYFTSADGFYMSANTNGNGRSSLFFFSNTNIKAGTDNTPTRGYSVRLVSDVI